MQLWPRRLLSRMRPEAHRLTNRYMGRHMEWYEKLKFARQVRGESLRDVEAATGISNAYLSQIENGEIKDPGFFVTVELLIHFNLHPSDLLPYNNRFKADAKSRTA